jgi:hypothetical protein
MSRQPLALRANHPAKPPLILRKEALELAISYAQECFRVAQSLADVADQKGYPRRRRKSACQCPLRFQATS